MKTFQQNEKQQSHKKKLQYVVGAHLFVLFYFLYFYIYSFVYQKQQQQNGNNNFSKSQQTKLNS